MPSRKRRRSSLRGGTCPVFHFEVRDRGDNVVVVARSPIDRTVSGTLRADRVDGALQVKAVGVDPDAQRCRVGTRLYEEIARVACADGVELRSDRRRSGYSEAFWRKQHTKGRARCNPGSGINVSYGDRRVPKEIRGKSPYWRCATWTLEAPCDATRTGLGKPPKSSCPHAKRFHELVTMTPAEIRAWAKDPRSKLASWASTRARLPKLAKLKAKPVERWTEADCKFAARVVSFNGRMDGMRKTYGCTTKIDVSLRNWGRRAPGCKLPKKPSR